MGRDEERRGSRREERKISKSDTTIATESTFRPSLATASDVDDDDDDDEWGIEAATPRDFSGVSRLSGTGWKNWKSDCPVLWPPILRRRGQEESRRRKRRSTKRIFFHSKQKVALSPRQRIRSIITGTGARKEQCDEAQEHVKDQEGDSAKRRFEKMR